MKTQTITTNYLKTICWQGEKIIDWASAGMLYSPDHTPKQLGAYHYTFGFDSAITSSNGEYTFIYKKLGTKGLLLKKGEILREINRSYYCANAYEFPAAFVTLANKTYLIHCPVEYNQLDLEDVETGELITNTSDRKPDDFFHSRLEVSPDGSFLLSRGWVWHPLDRIMIFDLKECLNNPSLLDESDLYPDVGVEVCTASFIDNYNILIGSSDEVFDREKIEQLPPNHISIWNLETGKLSKPTSIKQDFGNLFAISDRFTWDLFDFPKVIDINTGEIVAQNKEVNSGRQCSSIINETGHFPSIVFNYQTKQIAIKGDRQIEILTFDLQV